MKLNKFIITYMFISSLLFANEIPNTLIINNPNRPVTTVETLKKREKAEMNLNIKKITSVKIDGYINKDKSLISFILDEISPNSDFFLTINKDIFNTRTKSLKNNSSIYEVKNIDLTNKTVTFEYKTLPNEFYLVKYNKINKKLEKLYRWENQNTKFVQTELGEICFYFNENYKPFEIVEFSSNKKTDDKGYFEIKKGSFIQLDPKIAKEIVIREGNGEVLGKIPLQNGNGNLSLDNSKKGLILKNGSSILNFGIGFKENNISLQIKGTTDSTKEYSLNLDIVNLDDSIQEYEIRIKPAHYALKILDTSLALDFSNSKEKLTRSANKEDENYLLSESEISINSKGLDIKVDFINEGLIKLKKDENTIDGKLEVLNNDEVSNNQIKIFKVIGKIKKEDIKNIPDGEYTGKTELLVIIDS